MVFFTEASFVVLCAGIYRLGRLAFTPLVGLAAAGILCTRFDFPFLAARAYIDIPYLAIGERFALPISTGCAAHTDIAAALLSGLCEVIERDAIALLWLQRMAVPRLSLDGLGATYR